MSNEAHPNCEWIVETTDERFESDVLERSSKVLVVVDFWAEWCAPCRMLAPLLEQLARDYEGKFVLVKANTDQTPQAAGEFQVQGIPAVYAVLEGQIVDFFSGALPEPQLRAWLDASLEKTKVLELRELEQSDPAAAATAYRELLEQRPNETELQCGLARALLALEDFEACGSLIEQLEDRGYLEPELEKVKARLNMATRKGGDLNEIRAKAAAEPDNFALKLELASALAAAEIFEECLQHCLELVQQDRHGMGEEARKLMLEVFRVLPEGSELCSNFRRKLSLALY